MIDTSQKSKENATVFSINKEKYPHGSLLRGFTRTPTLNSTSTTTSVVREKTLRGDHSKSSAMLVCGFTVVESLVAITIIMMAVVAVAGAVRTGTIVSAGAGDTITARLLAQEAVEYVQNVRDSHIIDFKDTGDATTEWLGGLDACWSGAMCTVDISDPASVVVSPCVSGVCSVMKYDGSTGRYGYTTGANTKFTREVNITDVSGGVISDPTTVREAIVTVTVRWQNRSGFQHVEYQKNLFNWIN